MAHHASWQLLHQHYTRVKTDYHLHSVDILRQLGSYPYLTYLQYLSPIGINRTPSTRPNTIGKKLPRFIIEWHQ